MDWRREGDPIATPRILRADAPLGDLEDRVHLDRDAERERADADRGPRVAPALAEHRDHEVRGAVQAPSVVCELGGGVDEPPEPDAPDHAVEVAAARAVERREDVERAQAGGLLALFDRVFTAELADEADLSVSDRHLARD